MTPTVPAGINYELVARFFAEHVPGGGGRLGVELISGGKSNLTYLVRLGKRQWVLRRPPLGHVLPTAHDMAREFKVLSALADTGVPVPRTIALCQDPSVNGMPFYVMEYRRGVIVAEEMPEGYCATAGDRRRLSLALIDTLAELHAVDFDAVGLGEFGRPEGYLERQVRRWAEQWERSVTRPVPEIDELIRRLRASIPASPPPTIVHGDYRLGNMILAEDDPGEIVAILDWEMATLGDPLSDLGYTLAYWGDPDDPPERRLISPMGAITAEPGFLSRAELIGEYARRTGRSVESIEFYQVHALYKLACIAEGIHARFLKGETVGEGFEGYGERVEATAKLALDLADNAADRRLRGEA